MKKSITMPQFREEAKSSILCAWLKEEGEPVQKGDPLFEVETDKVVHRVEAAEDGIIVKRFFEEGDEVPADETVAELEV